MPCPVPANRFASSGERQHSPSVTSYLRSNDSRMSIAKRRAKRIWDWCSEFTNGMVAYISMRTGIDLTGQRSGKLVAVEYDRPRRKWRCLCECGSFSLVTVTAFRKRQIVSCGCWRKERPSPSLTHGMTHSPEYYSWRAMKRRCLNPHASQFHHYGGRGITIDPRWIASFKAFLGDMGHKPSRQHSIERRDNNAGYGPDNCYWATQSEQAQNTRVARRMTAFGVTGTVRELATLHGIRFSLVCLRLSRKWGIERALTEPVANRGQANS